MTPSKSKKALPSSTSMVFPEQPTSYEEWKGALVQVKSMYLKGQWKQCSARCSQLILEAKTPVRTFASDDISRADIYCSLILCTLHTFIFTLQSRMKQLRAQCTVCPPRSYPPLTKPRSPTKRQLKRFLNVRLSWMFRIHRIWTPPPSPHPLSLIYLRLPLLRLLVSQNQSQASSAPHPHRSSPAASFRSIRGRCLNLRPCAFVNWLPSLRTLLPHKSPLPSLRHLPFTSPPPPQPQ